MKFISVDFLFMCYIIFPPEVLYRQFRPRHPIDIWVSRILNNIWYVCRIFFLKVSASDYSSFHSYLRSILAHNLERHSVLFLNNYCCLISHSPSAPPLPCPYQGHPQIKNFNDKEITSKFLFYIFKRIFLIFLKYFKT